MVGGRKIRRLFTAKERSSKRRLRATVRAVAVLAAVAGLPSPAHAAEYRLLDFDGVFVKWGAATFGSGATVSWTLQQDERHQPDAINCQDTTSLDGLLARAGASREAFRAQAAAAFAMWQARSDLTFVEVRPGEKADIVIGAELSPRGIAWTNVDFERPAKDEPQAIDAVPKNSSPIVTLTDAAICLNPEMAWRVAPGAPGTAPAIAPAGEVVAYDLRLVLAHEIGHAIGLDHPGREGQLMGFAYQNDLTDLMTGDVSGVVKLYGVRPANAGESN